MPAAHKVPANKLVSRLPVAEAVQLLTEEHCSVGLCGCTVVTVPNPNPGCEDFERELEEEEREEGEQKGGKEARGTNKRLQKRGRAREKETRFEKNRCNQD